MAWLVTSTTPAYDLVIGDGISVEKWVAPSMAHAASPESRALATLPGNQPLLREHGPMDPLPSGHLPAGPSPSDQLPTTELCDGCPNPSSGLAGAGMGLQPLELDPTAPYESRSPPSRL